MTWVKNGFAKGLAMFLAALLIGMALPGGLLKAEAAAASGSWSDYADTSWYDAHSGDTSFTITTAAQLAGLAALVGNGDAATGNAPVNFSGKTIALGADIDLSGRYWVPIGIAYSKSFRGIFDGNGKTVSGMTIGSSTNYSSAYPAYGFFGMIVSGTIQNVNLTDAVIYSSVSGNENMTGGLAGFCEGGVLENCSVSGSIHAAGGYNEDVGGLAGLCQLNSTVRNCSSSGTVAADASYSGCGCYVGGLVGFLGNLFIDASSVESSHSTADVSVSGGIPLAGGLVGITYDEEDTITASDAAGDVKTEGEWSTAGGLVGASYAPIRACHATGNVDAKSTAYSGCWTTAGGLVGNDENSITESYAAAGTVSASSDRCYALAGGLAGSGGYITGCYSVSGAVSATGQCNSSDGGFNAAGGLVGNGFPGITESYSASGAVSVSGGSPDYSGGFVGYIDPLYSARTDAGCYFDAFTTGQPSDGQNGTADAIGTAGSAGSDAGLKGAAAAGTLSGFDFTSVWAVTAGTYPHLKALEETLRFDVNGGSGQAGPVAFNLGMILTAPASPTKENYTFTGWFASGGQAVDFSAPVMEGGTLTARWTPDKYPVTYHLSGGTNSNSNPPTYTYGEGLSPGSPTREGYTFAGWYGEPGFTEKVTSISASQSGPVTLYAKWTPDSYPIVYSLSGGTNSAGNPSSYTYGTPAALSDPAKTGCIFVGWYGEPSFKNRVTSIGGTQTGTVTLYADWIPDIISDAAADISFDLTDAALPSGVTSVAASVLREPSSADESEAVAGLLAQNSSLGSADSFVLYDLKLLDQNGSAITGFTGKITVKIPIPDGMSGDLHVYWYNPGNGTLTDMNARQENGYLVFETTHFSNYAIAGPSTNISSGSGTSASNSTSGTASIPNPDTGSGTNPFIPAILFGGILSGIVIGQKNNKNRRNSSNR